MLIGLAIVPVVSLFTKKPDQSRLGELFRPFGQLNEAVETAVEGYLTKQPSVSLKKEQTASGAEEEFEAVGEEK